jgi:hypothetical protein
MADTLGRTRSAFRIPRVEVDVAAVVLGAAGYLAYQLLWAALAFLFGIGEPALFVNGRPAGPAVVLRDAFFGAPLSVPFPGRDFVAGVVGHPGALWKAAGAPGAQAAPYRYDLGVWERVTVVVALLLLASIVGGAIARVYALRKARDESIGFDDALAFSLKSLRQYVVGHAFMAGGIALAAAVAIAAAAGIGVPFAGPVLQLVLQPVAIVAALVLTVFATGALLGYPLLVSAVAVERNGGLDAVSRTYSYAFARPVTYGLGAILILLVAGVIEGFAGLFVGGVGWVLHTGTSWAPDAQGATFAGLAAARSLTTPDVPAGAAAWPSAAWTWIAWVFGSATILLARGFVVAYVIGGFVDLYFLLREEVEGVSGAEVYVEGAGASLGEPIAGQPQ